VNSGSDEKKFEIGSTDGIPILGEHGFEVRTLEPGTRMELRDGSIVTVVENPHDGVWVVCQGVSGDIEPIWFYDFKSVVP